MYTYVQTAARPPLGYCTQAPPGTDNPWKMGSLSQVPPASQSHTFAEGRRGWREEKGGSLECDNCGFYLSHPPPHPRPDLNLPHLLREASHPPDPDAGGSRWEGCFC